MALSDDGGGKAMLSDNQSMADKGRVPSADCAKAKVAENAIAHTIAPLRKTVRLREFELGVSATIQCHSAALRCGPRGHIPKKREPCQANQADDRKE